ncbi:MAG TPA: Ku protein [Candidatus Babeliales bacterium]|jgi:DNA end-binding protein Ku|nr:Ku protein [Candidatus Babeliales bacterium]
MKAIWSGSLSFGLLNIPVHIYSAISEHKFGFKLLCGTCHNPLHNLRWCDHCKKEVAWDDTVKGFKKGESYVVMTKETIAQLKPEKMDTIDIKEFVPQSEIETLYIDNHYYILPKNEKDKAFYLFAQALEKSKKVAIGQFVMRDKEYVVAISFYNNMLLLNTLHYEYEIRGVELSQAKIMKATQEELALALLLINKLSHKTFKLGKYKDTFVEKLKKAIASAKKTKKVPAKKTKKVTKEKMEKKKSLVSSLKESLGKEVRA